MPLAATEARLRRFARTMGFVVRKSRSRSPQDPSFGGYLILDAWRNRIVAGAWPKAFSLDIDGVEWSLKDFERSGWGRDPDRRI